LTKSRTKGEGGKRNKGSGKREKRRSVCDDRKKRKTDSRPDLSSKKENYKKTG
jgi:hypothetical protein